MKLDEIRLICSIYYMNILVPCPCFHINTTVVEVHRAKKTGLLNHSPICSEMLFHGYPISSDRCIYYVYIVAARGQLVYSKLDRSISVSLQARQAENLCPNSWNILGRKLTVGCFSDVHYWADRHVC